jgi:hypothetical protein
MDFHVGREVLCHVPFQGFHFDIYGEIHGRSDGGNIGIDLFQLLLGHGEWMILGAKFHSWANFPWFFQKRDSLF